MIRALLSLYRPKYVDAIVYMLQNTEYQVRPYLAWYWRTVDFSRVMYRRKLEPTRAAVLLKRTLGACMAAQVVFGGILLTLGLQGELAGGVFFGLAAIVSYPLVWAHVSVLLIKLGDVLIVTPRYRKTIAAAEQVFNNHPAKKIAVVGSYGKTSMKELLVTVLGATFKVAATPANKNVAVSHAQFARTLAGDEEIIIVEYGEGAPGDVARFAESTHPTHAVITGIAPAHLDQYKTLEAAARDIFSVADFVDHESVFVNNESAEVKPFIQKQFKLYDRKGALGWKVRNAEAGFEGTSFVLARGAVKMKLRSGLLGRHHIGPLAFAAAFAYEQGMPVEQIKEAIAQTKPHEHRMQPFQLAGAWVIDDTYNGNIEGIRAGASLLKELPATRKLYITPGLVDQGDQTEQIHQEMGKLIASAHPDVVVLMQNSVTDYIKSGLESANYQGDLRTESDPLTFYSSLDQFLAVGDVALLQNDWPDNYR